MTREEKLAMGITLGHEAYRDGIVGDVESQMTETFDAVLGHTTMAKRVKSDKAYEDIMKGIISKNDNLRQDIDKLDYAIDNKDWSSFGEYVLDNYDYSADYWLLKTDGTIMWDGSKDLNAEYYDENGKLHTGKDAYKVVEDTTGSFSKSLLEYVGEERALQILAKQAGREITNIYDFSDEVILSVTGMTSESLEYLKQNHPAEYQKIYNSNKEELIAEALMYNQGKKWQQGNGWTGDFSALKMSDYDIGQVVINPIYDSNGKIASYERFAINASVTRHPYSNLSTRLIDSNGNSYENNYQGLDTITFRKVDLNGNVIDTYTTTGWQTVPNGYKEQFKGKDTAKAYPDNDSPYRGETVSVNQDIYWRWGNFQSDHYEGPVSIINRFKQDDGKEWGVSGSAYSTLGHSDSNWDSEAKKYVVYNSGKVSANCFINNVPTINGVYNKLYGNEGWGLLYNYDIKTNVKLKRVNSPYDLRY